MRRGVWVVVGLLGLAPGVALAQEARGQAAEQARVPEQVSNEVLQQQITELWQGFRLLQQQVAELREAVIDRQAPPAVGGAGQAGGAVSGWGPVGGAAGGAGQAGTGTAGGEPSDLIIVEMPAQEGQGLSGQAAGQDGLARGGAAMGGSGMDVGNQAAIGVPEEQVFLGRVRSVTEDRLLMVDPRGRVYEFGMNEQTRVMGPGGTAVSLRALREGMPVRTVAREGVERNQVVILQVLELPPRPSR